MFLGRWVGGLLGYKPFFKEYTTDWDYAVAKMKGSWFQRHLVHESYGTARSWKEQVMLDKGKVLNAEYEPWTIDLMQQTNVVKIASTEMGSLDSNKVNGLKP